MNLKTLKANVALQPLAVVMIGGMAFVAAFCMRSLIDHPDVNWVKSENPTDPYVNRQFKVVNMSGYDYAKGPEIPKYRD